MGRYIIVLSRRSRVLFLLLALVFLASCQMSGFLTVRYFCEDCADPVVCKILAMPQVSSLQLDYAGVAFSLLPPTAYLIVPISQLTTNLHAPSLVGWKTRMNN